MVEIGKKTQIVGEPFIDFDLEDFRSMAAYTPTGETRHFNLSCQFSLCRAPRHQYVFSSRPSTYMYLYNVDNELIEAHGPLIYPDAGFVAQVLPG